MKSVVMTCMTIFTIVGAYVPVLFGDNDMFSPWSILGAFVGGIFGIWLGVNVYKRWM